MSRIPRALTALLAAALTLAAQAQAPAAKGDFPNKPIRLVVTFPPGGSADAMVRMLVPRLDDKLGQQVLVDNRPGAGGNIGLLVVVKAPADGYTLGVGAAGSLAVNTSLYAQMPFDPLKDFKPVTLLAATPFVFIGHPSTGAKTLRELITLAKTRPGQISVGHGGNGTTMHLAVLLLEQMAGVKLVKVPYKGSGPASVDVLAGQLPLAVVDLPSALPHIKAGKLVAYGVTSPQRVPMLPDVPTVSEQGLTGYDSTGWLGVVAPARTPAPAIARLNAEITAALNDPDIKTRMRNLGIEPAPSRPEEFEAYIKSETKKWAKIVKAAGIKPE